MRRREFMITLLGGATALPIAARAQQPAKLPVIGYVRVGSPTASAEIVAAFQQGLKETGYVSGQNLLIEFRWPEDQGAQLREAMDDLVSRRVAVIIANGNSAAAAAKAATIIIPVVFIIGGDPVAQGLVASLNRPGGNLTGIGGQSGELVGKQLLRELMPTADLIAYLTNPANLDSRKETEGTEAAGRASTRHRVATVYTLREYAVAGGLMA
jgi:putative ABC transport system substrate-binding protein